MPVLKNSFPNFYFKLAMVLVSIIALGYIAILGEKILCPLLFSFLFSILLLPLANFFEKKLRLPRSAASLFSVLTLIAGIALIFYLVGSQLTNLLQDWPLFKAQLLSSINNLQNWITTTFNVNIEKQKTYVNNVTSNMLSSGTAVIGATVLSLSSILLFLVFLMIDTFFLLFYRRLLMKFLVAVFKEENSVVVYDIIENVQYIIRRYILGLLLEMGIVATVCCIAFWILGIKYAILLGVITGLFNIIPYVGIFTALLLSTIITFGTAAVASKVVLVIVVIVCMHLIDSNFLLPLIVGSKVKINALITVLGVVVGEMLWGIPGMFLSLPVIAISKIIFDRIESLKPWGLLLGDEKDEKKPTKLRKKFRQKQATGETIKNE
ncbi:MAG: AI-2E family transporter [Chitinophagaceae bacterium]